MTFQAYAVILLALALPAATSEWTTLSEPPPHDAVVSLIFGLRRTHQARSELDTAFSEVTNPESAQYSQYYKHRDMADLMHPGDQPVAAVKSWLASKAGKFHNASFTPWKDNVVITAPASAIKHLLSPGCKLVLRKHPERAALQIALKTPYNHKEHELASHLWRISLHGSHTSKEKQDEVPLAVRQQLPPRRAGANRRTGTAQAPYVNHYWPPTQQLLAISTHTDMIEVPVICPYWPSYEVPMSLADFSKLPVSPTTDPIQPCRYQSTVYNTTEQLLGYNITFIPDDGSASIPAPFFAVDFATSACYHSIENRTTQKVRLTNSDPGTYAFTVCGVAVNYLALEDYKTYFIQVRMVFSNEESLPQAFLDGLTYNMSAYVPGNTSQDGEPLTARTARSIAYSRLKPTDQRRNITQDLKDFYSIPASTAQWSSTSVSDVPMPTQAIVSNNGPEYSGYVPSSIDSFASNYGISTESQSSSDVKFMANPNTTVPCWNNSVYGSCISQSVTKVDSPSAASVTLQYLTAIAPGVPTQLWEGGYFDPPLSVSYGGEDGPGYLLGIFLAMQYSTPPSVVSLSWGTQEVTPNSGWYAYMADADDALKALGLLGTTVIVGVGDTGAHLTFQSDLTPSQFCAASQEVIAWPASSPYVIAVGASQFVQRGSGCETLTSSCVHEILASQATGAGITSGGGLSGTYAVPSWQARVQSTGKRTTPDLVMAGSHLPYVMTFIGGGPGGVDLVNKYIGSGTTFSAPIFAGVVTMWNKMLAEGGYPTVGFLNEKLYTMYELYPQAFNDIQSGDTRCGSQDTSYGVCCAEGYDAAAGFDIASGMGSIKYNESAAYLKCHQLRYSDSDLYDQNCAWHKQIVSATSAPTTAPTFGFGLTHKLAITGTTKSAMQTSVMQTSVIQTLSNITSLPETNIKVSNVDRRSAVSVSIAMACPLHDQCKNAGEAVVSASKDGSLLSTLNARLTANMRNAPTITGCSCNKYTLTNNNESNDGNELADWKLALIIAGGIVGALIIVAFLVLFCRPQAPDATPIQEPAKKVGVPAKVPEIEDAAQL